MEMYLAGVSTRRIEDVSEILWGSSVSAATVSNLNEKAFASVGGVAEAPARARLPLRLRRRDIPEAQLGRRLRERDNANVKTTNRANASRHSRKRTFTNRANANTLST